MNAYADTARQLIGTHQTFRGAEYVIRFWRTGAMDMLGIAGKEDAVTMLALINRKEIDDMTRFPALGRNEVSTLTAAYSGMAITEVDRYLTDTGNLLSRIIEPNRDSSTTGIQVASILDFMRDVQRSMLQKLLET